MPHLHFSSGACTNTIIFEEVQTSGSGLPRLCFYSQWHQDPWTTAEVIGFQLSIPDESGFEPASDAELFALLGDSQTRV